MIEIHNEDCFVTMERMNPHSVDVVLTSPFYNTKWLDALLGGT